MKTYYKDKDALLDYQFDWSDWLETGDTISASTWVVSGVTKDSDSNTDTTTTIWVDGGTVGTDGYAINSITTANGRKTDRTMHFVITEN